MSITATYVSSTVFTVETDRTTLFTANRLVKLNCGVDGDKYGTIVSSVYTTLTTVTISESVITPNLAYVFVGISQSGSVGSLPVHSHNSNFGQGGDISGSYVTTPEHDFSTRGATVTEVWDLDDFAPSGGVITLSDGLYQIKDTIDIGENRFEFASGNPFVLMQMDDSFNNYIYHTGSNMTLISGNGALRFLRRGVAFVLDGNNVTFIDIIGSLGFVYSYLGFFGTGGRIGYIRGKIIDQSATAGLIMRESILDGWEDGIEVINGLEVSSRDTSGEASDSATGSFISIKGSGRIVISKGASVVMPSGSSFINIDPTVTISSIITNYFVYGGADFFKQSTKNGIFTAVTDASIGSTNITSVTDSGGTARFNFTGPTLYVYQEVIISGFVTNADEYNGTFNITSTDGTTYFEIDTIDFGSDEATGSFTSNSITLTEASTTAANGDSIMLDTTDCTCYDIGSYVYNKLTNSFQVNAVYDSDKSGTWMDGSQTEKSKYVMVRDCGEQGSSQSLSSIYVTGNADTITATSDTWVDLDLGTALDSSASSRFKLVDSEKGVIEYTGLNPFHGILTASISAFKSSASNVLHQFRVYKSVGSPVFETILAEKSLDNTLGNVTLITPVSLEPHDRFKLQIKAVGSTTIVTIQNITVSVR